MQSLAEQYAAALDSLHREGTLDHDELIRRFKSVLAQKGHSALYPQVVAALEKRWERAEGQAPHLYVSESDLSKEEEEQVEEVRRMLTIGDAQLIRAVDPTLVGGFRLETTTDLYDASYKRALISLYQRLVA